MYKEYINDKCEMIEEITGSVLTVSEKNDIETEFFNKIKNFCNNNSFNYSIVIKNFDLSIQLDELIDFDISESVKLCSEYLN